MATTRTTVADLVERFREIRDTRMRGLPIINPALEVDAVGFRVFEDGLLGVLITPWFMNLVYLRDEANWSSRAQGDVITIEFPCGDVEFTVSHDERLGAYLSAVLFRSVSDFPDQKTARTIALQVMDDLFVKPARGDRHVSRRQLLTGLENS